jgi:CubicO group peptidase (beta-lactamase class C family)
MFRKRVPATGQKAICYHLEAQGPRMSPARIAQKTFPTEKWETIPAAEAGMKAETLEQAVRLFDGALGDRKGRLAVARRGRIVVEHCHNMGPEETRSIASANKSIYTNVLGVVIAEGRLTSADELVVDHYPEMMDVKDGEGNKPGRYAFEVNRGITFRHLICNVSGYMKPGEEPGKVFNYQTWGMNVLTCAMAKIYGLYDTDDPERLPGFKVLMEEKIGKPIRANWRYGSGTHRGFSDRLRPGAKLNIFGFSTGISTTALDFARLGWLWCNWGRWEDQQVIPEKWMRESSVTAPDILANCPEEQWIYGHGIWTNDQGTLWPELPRGAFTSSGAGGHYCTVFPSKELVVVQNPGKVHSDDRSTMANPDLLKTILDAIEE